MMKTFTYRRLPPLTYQDYRNRLSLTRLESCGVKSKHIVTDAGMTNAMALHVASRRFDKPTAPYSGHRRLMELSLTVEEEQLSSLSDHDLPNSLRAA